MPDHHVAVGLDMGTGGARAVAIDLDGTMIGHGRSDLPAQATTVRATQVEQDPRAWTEAAFAALRQMSSQLPSSCHIAGIAADATSGTFLLTDADHQPITRGIMYNDLRAVEETEAVASAVDATLAPFGIRVAPAFALPKIVHLLRHDSQLMRSCGAVVHQTDWIVGQLCGHFNVTDISTALKTGADPGTLTWPTEIQSLGLDPNWLPRVVLPGTPIGTVSVHAAKETGLPEGTPVVSGCTDGTAGCLASGAARTGDLNVTLGTTLVFKAIADSPLIDPDGVIYNHRHPAGGYLPGAASSTGAEWVKEACAGHDLNELGRTAATLLPTPSIVYPLAKTGERFPFASSGAIGFGLTSIDDPAVRFAAGMQGVAFLERMGIARLEHLGLEINDTVYATGGAVAGETWLQVRASVNRRVYSVPHYPECAVGAAVLAAMPHFGGYSQAALAIVQPGCRIEPVDHEAERYDAFYNQFQEELMRRGYLTIQDNCD